MLAATVHSLRSKYRATLLEAYTAYCAHEPSLPLSGFLTFADSFDISSYLSAERVADIFEQVISTPARRGGKGSISFEEFKEAICLCALAVSDKQWQARPPRPRRTPLPLLSVFSPLFNSRRSSTPPKSAYASSTGVPTPTSRMSRPNSSRRAQPPPPPPRPAPPHCRTAAPGPRPHRRLLPQQAVEQLLEAVDFGNPPGFARRLPAAPPTESAMRKHDSWAASPARPPEGSPRAEVIDSLEARLQVPLLPRPASPPLTPPRPKIPPPRPKPHPKPRPKLHPLPACAGAAHRPRRAHWRRARQRRQRRARRPRPEWPQGCSRARG